MRLRRRPDPPSGVRIVRRDGTTLDVEVVYRGREHGLDVWVIANAVMRNGDAVTVERLPARTSVTGEFQP